MNASIPESIGNFRILGKIGQGGMGTVYRAVHGTLERPCALKVLPNEFSNNPEYVMRFLREARTIATLRNNNIVQVYDAGEYKGQYFIAMELVEGANLGVFADEHSPVAESEGLDLLMQAAKGLAAAHSKGLVHRDIKPENLLLGNDGHLRIVDFGLVMESTSTTQLTATGACLGTPMYMSPEQADGENADARTDIYSLGVTFYRIFTGHTPFTSPTVMNLLFKHKFEAPPEPRSRRPDLTQNLNNLLLHMLAKKREDRPQTAEQLISMIEQVKQGVPLPPPPRFVPMPVMAGGQRGIASNGLASTSATDVTVLGPGSARAVTPPPPARRAPVLGMLVICIVLAMIAGLAYGLNKLNDSVAAQSPTAPASSTNTAVSATALTPGDAGKTDAPKAAPGDDAIVRGDRAFAAGNLEAARDEYKIGLALDSHNGVLLQSVKKAEDAIAFKAAIEAGTTLEGNGQWDEAKVQYETAQRYGPGAEAKLDAINKKIAERKQLDTAGKNSSRDLAMKKGEEAEKSFRYDVAAEMYSRAAGLSVAEPEMRKVLADKARECRRQDYIAQAKAAEALQEFADAESKYKRALDIKPDDSLVAEKIDALHKQNLATPPNTNATVTSADPKSVDKDYRDAIDAARAALSSGNVALARQKAELARKIKPGQADLAGLSNEIDARDLIQQADAARSSGDKARAAQLYKRAQALCPGLNAEITTKLNGVQAEALPAAAAIDLAQAKLRDSKDEEALAILADALRADPNNVELQQLRTAADAVTTAARIYHELNAMFEQAKGQVSDAIDFDDDDKNRSERAKVKKWCEEAANREAGVRQLFAAHDFAGLNASLTQSRADAERDSKRFLESSVYFTARADKAERGMKVPLIGNVAGDKWKSDKYRHIADEFKKYGEQAKALH